MGNYLAPLKKWLYINKSTNMLDIILLLLLLFIVFFQFFLFYRSRQLSIPSYRIAVIGFPRSGKTTLITVLLRHILNQERRDNVSIVLRGSSTIDKFNDDYARLERCEPLGSTTDTTDKGLFTYRFDMEKGRWFKQRYKIDVGDLSGEDSEKFSKDFNNMFYRTHYFKWVMEADAFMIVFDIASLLQDEKTANLSVIDFTNAIKSAWQHLAESHYEDKKNLKNKPVVLVFAKFDLFGILDKTIVSGDVVSKKVRQLGFDEIPETAEIEGDKLQGGMTRTIRHFSELIRYFENESNQFSIVFASSFSLSGDSDKSERLGMKELTDKILPAKLYWHS